MRKVIGASGAASLLAVVCLVVSAGAAAPTASAGTLDCKNGIPGPCIKYCPLNNDGAEAPCGVGTNGVPNLTSGSWTFTSNMSAAQQDATGIAGDPGATGTTTITLTQPDTVCATTTWSGIDSPVVAGHIHGGASGQPENPGITIDLFPLNLNGQPSGISGCTTVAPGEIAAMVRCPKEFSTVVHSKNNPVGAIRGQLGTSCVV